MEEDPLLYYEVPENERKDEDTGDASVALDGGDDTDHLDEIYANPGEPVDLGGE